MKRVIEVGKKYRHFKGKIVEVLALAKDSEDLRDLVVYKHDDQVWVRDYDVFISLVDKEKYPTVTQKYRFEEVEE
jgi:hypothetical protein